ncbi:MAG: methyltransferase [Leptospiraceae bacterium]|nr:MAG: methyltransferase [Leptospiraceae bacterium]
MKNFVKVIFGDSRNMSEVEDCSIDLIITSPPYWNIKNYGVDGQIGFGQNLHDYLKNLYLVWKECYRILKEGRRLCINIGDQFARSIIYGKYKVIPLHAEIILQCEDIGFDYMGSIIWQKKTTMNTTGGANIMGSYPYPPNGMIEIDYEYILLFKKSGKMKKISKEIKEKSKLSKEEWKEYYTGHWNFSGERQLNHEAMFPEELPKRLIKMFSFVGDIILDPFLGSGTTLKMAIELGRNGIGYEINYKYKTIIEEKLTNKKDLFHQFYSIDYVIREDNISSNPDLVENYKPVIKNIIPRINPDKFNFKEKYYKVVKIINESTIQLSGGLQVTFLGIEILKKEDVLEYLNKFVLNKEVYLKFSSDNSLKLINNEKVIKAYVYLKNKIFINRYLIKSGMAKPNKDFKIKI